MGRRIVSRKTSKQEKDKKESAADIEKELDKNLSAIRELLANPNDLVVREFTVGVTEQRCGVLFIDGLVDKAFINDFVLKNLQFQAKEQGLTEKGEKLLDALKVELISLSSVKAVKSFEEISNALLYGSTILFADGVKQALVIDAKGWESRAIMEPQSETLIRGPREGFTENMRTNTVLLRRHIRDQNLRFETHVVGRRSKKNLVVAYIEGLVHPDIVKELNRRLKSIDMDDAQESGYIEQWIEDSFLSPFPQFINTERPDKVSAAIMRGKVGIILDGTPFVLIAPTTFGNTLQSPEDFYERWSMGTFIRSLRYLAAFIAIFLPSLYIALVSYHQGMIPSKLAFSIAATREGVPFPAVVEAILMALTMELLREAGARLPKTIGQTIGIVGGLVIGEAAVSAGIVSPVMVVVVALTAISSFTIPSYSVAISFRLMRFGIMIAAAILGLYGIVLAYIMINIHIVNLKSVGVPYSAPFAPSFYKDWRNLVLRLPIPLLTNRPGYLKPEDSTSADKKG
ncbi:spore germination protein [Virgibacillus kekensis]|uniref:Spore germination protein n=1 Tax=Virgibacillus kekensis TaxID=202261 RepID=A0ABV9DLC0_9BACI